MKPLTYTGPNGFSATIEENPDGTFTLTSSPIADHKDTESCGSLEIAEAEVFARMKRAARG